MKKFLKLRKFNKTAYLFIIPGLLMVVFFKLVPVAYASILSFTDARLLTMLKRFNFIGFENYKEFILSSGFISSLGATFIYVVGGVFFSYCSGLFIASIMNQKFKLNALIRGILILPWAVPNVVVVLIFKWMYNPKYGIITWLLNIFGLVPRDFSILTNSNLAMLAVILMVLWKGYPISAVMLLAGLKSIPDELYEAASIDGANPVQQFFHITMPGLKYVSSVLILMLTIWSIGSFVFIWLTTGGGPGDKTSVLAIHAYKNAFIFGDIGRGAAIGVVSLIISLSITIIYLKLEANRM
jgi:multiple sugar transport system permease protein